ncbi:MAG: hypothetical protein WAU24_13645 [Chitinophagaceae bacterium]
MNTKLFSKNTGFYIFTCAFLLMNTISFAQTDSTATDSILLKQVAQEMQANTAPENVPQQTRSGISSNPDIGVIGDFRTAYTSLGNKNFDAYLNETEVSFQSVVDPYIRADFFVSFSRDPETHKYGVDVEEGYLTTLSLPAKLQLKAGKFREAVGRINPMHPHALPFIDLPNAYVNYFGEEGLNDEGLSISWLTPAKFYQEIIFQATSGTNESPSFYRGDNNRLLYLAHLKNFFTLNDNTTLELGLTGISGPNDSSAVTNIGAVDITYKWKPVQMNTYKSLTWQSEFFYSNAKYSSDKVHNSFGLYSFIEDQIAKRWFLTGRYDYAQKPYDNSITEQAYSVTTGWLATEFQKIELEGKYTTSNLEPNFYQMWLRWIFVIGAHGAHQY